MEFTASFSKRVKFIFISMVSLLAMGAVFFATVHYLNRGEQSIQGLHVGSHQVGRMSSDEINILLAEKVEDQSSSTLVLKTEEGGQIETTPGEIGVTYNIEGTAQNILSYGKTGNLLDKTIKQTKALLVGVEIPFQATISTSTYASFVKNNLSSINMPAQNAAYEYNKETESFVFVPARSGLIVDKLDLYNKLLTNVERLAIDPVVVLRHHDEPVVEKEEDTLQAKQKAEEILESMPFTVNSRSSQWEIEKGDIISWIKFVPVLDRESNTYDLSVSLSKNEIADYLMSFAPGLNTPAKDARFTVENGRATAFTLATKGYELNAEESAKVIADNILNLREESTLVFTEIEPEITNESINNMGITALIGRGESDFSGSPSSRRHNIKVGADKYQGLLVSPGEEFSFNESLGRVTASEGYLPELVIKNGQTIPEYGGGICQVSTTLFRAAVYGGLEITKRYNHSYPVVYYGKPGFDATIYPPNPDFRFINNTDGHLLIQYEITDSTLIFELYGKDDGRRTEVDGPHLYDQQPNGAVKAWLTQTVYNSSGNVMHEKTFYSNYKSPSLYPVNRNPLE